MSASMSMLAGWCYWGMFFFVHTVVPEVQPSGAGQSLILQWQGAANANPGVLSIDFYE
jgi:hypothetical protein